MKRTPEDIALSKAVLIVQYALRDRFDHWKKKSKEKSGIEVFKTMESTYDLVQDFIAGMFKDILDNQNIV